MINKQNFYGIRVALLCLFAFLFAGNASAVPAKPGMWRTITLKDGSTVRAQLVGDENVHFYQANDGKRYSIIKGERFFQEIDDAQIKSMTHAKSRIPARYNNAASAAKSRIGAASNNSIFQGKKRGLIILAEFPNMKFTMPNPTAVYDSIANYHGYSAHGFNGSVSDYFREQSGGQFDLTFDVKGPVMMKNNYGAYGQNNERNAQDMIQEAVEGIADSTDFSRYDWDGDGTVEEVFVLYAGHGQADYSTGDDTEDDKLIWPHMSQFSTPLTYGNENISVYACSSELNGAGGIAGIGTFCHEFSHCMGFPDMYDTSYSGNFGMMSWDLMDQGSYNGNGYTPAGYTAYERMVTGWTTPTELTEDTQVTGMKSLADMGQTYIIYNQANRNEYYLLENRQQKNYDAQIPGHGMLITHVDYDKSIWDANTVNTTGSGNDHQRITIFHADNTDSYSDQFSDPYPYEGNDSLTNNSVPVASLYNANTDGLKYMNRGITNIHENADGTMGFTFKAVSERSISSDGILFRETFSNCAGTGGNDGRFSGRFTAIGNFGNGYCDNDGWSNGYANGANQCASLRGEEATPAIYLPNDTVTLSFRAACWDVDADSTLTLTLDNDLTNFIDTQSQTITVNTSKGVWQNYSLKILGKGNTRITFNPGNRCFLDDVVVSVDRLVAAGIKSVVVARKENGLSNIYTITGQYVGKRLDNLPKGIYIVNGKKYIKK